METGKRELQLYFADDIGHRKRVRELCHLVLVLLSKILKTNLVWNCFIFSPLERISMSEVTISQLIAYDPERDLLPLILAHCNYSLEVGQETLVQYDWTALERQLTDRFLKGRPFVEFKVRHLWFLINYFLGNRPLS